MRPQSGIHCQLRFSNNVLDFPASEMFTAEPGFDAASGKVKMSHKSEIMGAIQR